MSQKQRKGSVGVRSERCWLLDGNLLTSLSTALEVSPYRDGTGREGVFGMARREGLATNCVSYCSCTVRASRVVLMLFLETCCLSVSS